MMANPIWKNLWQIIIDLAHFYVVPILGGIFAIIVMHDYEQEQYSYQLANLDMNDLYKTNLSFIKDGIYTLVGRPFLFDVNPSYVPPQIVDITKLPGWS